MRDMDLCCSSYMKELELSLNSATSFDDLPDGLVVDILSRLPAKTLIQSTCVSKLWYSTIKSPSFISAHLSRSIYDPSCYCIFLSHYHSPSVSVISANPLVTRHQDFKFPFETHSTYIELIGACNGLICVTDSYPTRRGRDIYLTNPFIHKYKRLDAESSCYADLIRKTVSDDDHVSIGFGDSGIEVNIGFGYSEVDDDYKVLRIITHSADTDSRKCVFINKVEIYSLKSDKWKALDVSIPIEVAPFISPAFMHGCLYWRGVHLTHVEDSLKLDEYLLCFDLKDELFSRIELPKTYFRLFWTWHSGVFVKNGSLAIVLCTKDPESDLPFTKICLLVLEKGSGGQIRWEEFNYECANFNPRQCIGFDAMGLCGGGRFMFVANTDLRPEYIVAVDLDNSCAIQRLALDFTDDRITEATNVSESLVLLSD